MLRAEAVASSRIEGLEVGGRRLLKAQAARVMGQDPSDVTAAEILNNIEAMSWAVGTLSAASKITVDDLLSIHRRLLAGTRLRSTRESSAAHELDRRQRLQPVLGCVHTAPA